MNGSVEINTFTISINETTSIGTSILNITIVDLDIETNLNLGILNGNFQNAFTFILISDNSDNAARTYYEAIGELKLITSLDCGLKQNYTLTLSAFDTKNVATLNVIVDLQPQNTKAPSFVLQSNCSFDYEVFEETEVPILDGCCVS